MTQKKYTKDHEYIIVEDGIGAAGITNYAQEKLGDVTFVELPAIGLELTQGDPVGVVESVKAASDIYSPVSGTVAEVNTALNDKPELLNEDAEGAAWIFKLKLADPSELDKLMDQEAYLAFASAEG
jgi:glycine cleavage system H protein